MATLNLILTNDGLISSIIAQQREGWYIKPTTFSVSDTTGSLVKTRTEASKNTVWYTAAISSVVTNYPNSLTFICTIPPAADTVDHAIAEFYVTAEDSVGATFLLGIAHPQNDSGADSTLFYDHGGSLTVRMMLTIQNADLSTIMDINYTQATEIAEHELTEDAHYSTIQRAIHKAGIFVQDSEFEYEGQTWDQDVTVDATVFNGAIVTRDAGGYYKSAIVSTGLNCVGVALHYKGAKQWVANTHYRYGELVYPPTLNNHTYKATVAGESNSSQPVWPTAVSGTVTDNEVTWQEFTEWFVVFSGLIKFPAALLPAGTVQSDLLYLDTATVGRLTKTVTDTLIGQYLGNNIVFVWPKMEVQNHRHDGGATVGHAMLDYAGDTGSGNAYAITLNPALPANVVGMPIRFRASHTNTGSATLNINGLGSHPIIKQKAVAYGTGWSYLDPGDIVTSGIYEVLWDGNTNYQLINCIHDSAFTSGGTAIYSGTTLTSAHFGMYIHLSGTFTLNLPATATAGAKLYLYNVSSGVITLAHASMNILGSHYTTYSLRWGGTMMFIGDGTSWNCYSPSNEPYNNRSLGTNGFQVLPGGLIMAWGVGSETVVANTPKTGTNFTLATAINTVLSFQVTGRSDGAPTIHAFIPRGYIINSTTARVDWETPNNGTIGGTLTYNYLIIGY